ncbi:MAG TPA: hypothetical protein VJN18_32615 [Polyangiaceae bacterium]|nr:hypothetical protein [Polyangiaceae bacterium]
MAADNKRAQLVRLAEGVRKRAKLPAGFNLVVVVTDPNGDWVGVSSSADDDYTARILTAALEGADKRSHRNATIEATASGSDNG